MQVATASRLKDGCETLQRTLAQEIRVATASRLKDGCEELHTAKVFATLGRNGLSAEGWLRV